MILGTFSLQIFFFPRFWVIAKGIGVEIPKHQATPDEILAHILPTSADHSNFTLQMDSLQHWEWM